MASFHQSSVQGTKKYRAKLCFLLDTTGSMNPQRDAVVNLVEEVVHYCTTKYPIVLEVAFLGYKDVSDQDEFQRFDFTENYCSFQDTLRNVACSGGGDEAEDVLGGMNEALKLTWDHSKTDMKVLVHIADSPHHGAKFHEDGSVQDNHKDLENSPRPYNDILADFADNHIDYTFVAVKNPSQIFTTNRMLELFRESYNSNPSRMSDFAACSMEEFTPKNLLDKVKSSLRNSIQMFMKTVSLRKGIDKDASAAIGKRLSTVIEETSTGSVGTDGGLALAMEKFGVKEVETGGVSRSGHIKSDASIARSSIASESAVPSTMHPSKASSTSVSFGMGKKVPASNSKSAESVASTVPATSHLGGSSTSVSFGMGKKVPASTSKSAESVVSTVPTTSHLGGSSTSVSFGMGKKVSSTAK